MIALDVATGYYGPADRLWPEESEQVRESFRRVIAQSGLCRCEIGRFVNDTGIIWPFSVRASEALMVP